ncbi:MAG: Uma2 family endonuclease [Thermoanaerobaculia bacterium]
MATLANRKFTYEELRAMPQDGKRYELLDGEVYMAPSPNRKHQKVVGNLYVALRRFVEEHDLGEVYLAPFDVVLSEQNVVQPDILFVRKERLLSITPLFVNGAPDLVVEVLSPGNADFDRQTKRRVYAAAGVPEVWYIDPRDDTFEVLRLSGGAYETAHRLSGDARLALETLSGFDLPLSRVFA